jgi:hypothetical protein
LRYRFDVAKKYTNDYADGWLIGAVSNYGDSPKDRPAFKPPVKPEKPVYDPAALKKFAGHFAQTADLIYLANRSALDPAEVDSETFLQTLYGDNNGKILMFSKCAKDGSQVSQGEALWPDDAPLKSGPYGVWMLPQPVSGEFSPNVRSKKEGAMSRRHAESCLAFPYMVLESDSAPLREWLGCLVQLPLRIAAIYSSGGRSVHALVKVNTATAGQWQDVKAALAGTIAFLIKNGLDKGVLSSVRLTRLPGAFREGKAKEEPNGSFTYEKFDRPKLQKLLYINPDPQPREICDLFPVRDVVKRWTTAAAAGVADADDTGGQWLFDALRYYTPVSREIAEALTKLKSEQEAVA